MTLHENEVSVDESTVRGLLRAQRPDLADLTVAHVGGGTDNTMYRIGADLLARFPRTREKVTALEKELTWLPRLRSHLPYPIPTPVHAGRPGPDYPFPWALYTWIDGEEVSDATVADWHRYGRELAEFVSSLHSADRMGATRSGDLSWYRGGTLRPHDGWVGPCFADARGHGVDLDFERLDKLLVLTRAATARRMSVGAFIAQSALDLANGRLDPVRKGHAAVVSHEQAEVLRGLGRDLMDARRQLAGAATNLNQLTRAVNAGVVLPVEQIEAALAHVVEQIGRTDVVTSRVGEAARLSR